MSLGENLQVIRKKHSLTQEQLAEKLEVSRQSVSKWESDSTYPEINTLLQICELYSCDLDTLIRGDMAAACAEDCSGYDKHMNRRNKLITGAIFLILIGLSLHLLIDSRLGAEESGEALAAIAFFICIIISVVTFVVAGMQHDYFVKKNPYVEPFYHDSIVDEFNRRKAPVFTAGSIGLIMIGLILTSLGDLLPVPAGFNEDIYTLPFLLLVAIAVPILAYTGMQKSKYDIQSYNKAHSSKQKDLEQQSMTTIGKWCACIMLTAVILFIVMIFVGVKGSIAVLPFPVGGILCGIVAIILNKAE